MSKRNIGIIIAVIAIVGSIIALFVTEEPEPEVVVPEPEVEYPVEETIGFSVEGREIERYTFLPEGVQGIEEDTAHLLFVGGIHGGYEWNSVVLAYEFIDYFDRNRSVIPDGVAVSIIPSLNPDGVYEVVRKEGRFAPEDVPDNELIVGTGRFNARGVDLNRNFDCKWQSTSMWRGEEVSAGTRPFSEPEAQTLREFIQEQKPDAVVFWHSQANAVYASECENGILPETTTLMNAYAGASGYQAIDTFDAYTVTGDAEGWLASIGIPAVTVELSSHEAVEWEKNVAGVRALLDLYGK